MTLKTKEQIQKSADKLSQNITQLLLEHAQKSEKIGDDNLKYMHLEKTLDAMDIAYLTVFTAFIRKEHLLETFNGRTAWMRSAIETRLANKKLDAALSSIIL